VASMLSKTGKKDDFGLTNERSPATAWLDAQTDAEAGASPRRLASSDWAALEGPPDTVGRRWFDSAPQLAFDTSARRDRHTDSTWSQIDPALRRGGCCRGTIDHTIAPRPSTPRATSPLSFEAGEGWAVGHGPTPPMGLFVAAGPRELAPVVQSRG
jgi:hypothetical protein